MTGRWTVPLARWDAMFTAGVRAHYVASVLVAPLMIEQGHGLIVNISTAAEHFDLSNSESPQFIGRAVAALAADPEVMRKSGQVLVAAELAEEYGFTDVDGRRPASLRATELPSPDH
jgi:dehydrogenase/reductase SDR family member 1